MARQANAIDFWRGFALVTIFINHVPGIYFERFTHRNISPSDSAELFVFLAGWALRLSIKSADDMPAASLVHRLTRRALIIYAAQIMITTLALAMLASAARALDNPLLLEWHNAAAVFYDPINAHIGLALLTHQLGYFDILPLYVTLMLIAAPVIALIHRAAPRVLLPLSLAIYVVTLAFRIHIPSWPVPGHWLFNPLAWQLVFVLGFCCAGRDGVGGLVRAHIVTLRRMALPVVLFAAAVVWFDLWPDPTRLPEPRLFFIGQKTFVTPIRLVQFLALVAVMSAAYPAIAEWAGPADRYLSLLGRNSLNVFCVGSLASLAAQILRFAARGGIGIDAAIVIVGIVLLGLTAWISEWSSRSHE